jgi:CheY-like chemotaxis protein
VETVPHTVEINLDSYPPPLPTAPQPESTSVAEINEPLTDRHALTALQGMRQCFTAYTRNSADLSLLNELHSHLHGLAERARVSGFVALHRLSSACSALCQQLYEIPEMVNPSTVRTIHQTIEFLTVLLKEKALAQLKDPAKAMIYIVDDDLENCQAIAMAMETVMVRTTFAQEPAVALGELASGRFDLIFLDVNLPGMDGFQLCAHIRELAIHTTTPIVFISGMTSMENRVQSSLSGGNEFVSKPFNLNELSVKALMLMLKDQLNIA